MQRVQATIRRGSSAFKTANEAAEKAKAQGILTKRSIENLKVKKVEAMRFEENKINLYEQYEENMLHFGVYQNAYFKNIEGKQAVQYRRNWNAITKFARNSTYRMNMKPAMRHLNAFHEICNQSKPFISTKELRAARKAIVKFHAEWQIVKEKCVTNNTFSLGKKEHYVVNHHHDFMKLWRVPLGYGNEQSTEHFHKKCDETLAPYSNQRGRKKAMCFARHMFLLTSPKYQNY